MRRYAYTAKLPLSILTDFEEFAVYDTRIKPNKDDKSGTGRIFYCTFNEYEQHFDFLYNTFSKEAINKGSFDKYIEENKNKKGTSEVDTELLALVEQWRMELAKNIAKNNPDLSVYSLNTVVQRIIDRIVFLRIAEDRGIEDENLLLSVAKSTNIYEKLILIFTKANAKYNSGLFAPFDWINDVHIDDKVLQNIIVNLYYPECPYEFSVLPIEILGSIYERFLGKTIRFRVVKGKAAEQSTHTAIIEEKPEVKKAGGVFYTPQYIVDYIVQNTVGEKIKNKTPQEIAAIKICDPACGSGSFLVGAYQYLLNYHLDYYSKEKNVKSALKNAKIYEAGFNSHKLTIEEKQRILTSCIYGVDIDSQAVEVTKLSLYLKLLEDEGKQYKDYLFKYSDNTLLPSLEENIKCGNSLIGTDFYTQGDLDFSEEDRIKVNCFDWEKKSGFEEIFKAGGFDVVIGNPPYVLVFDELIKKHIENNYYEFQRNNDMYIAFMIKGMRLLKESGIFSFITPNTYLKGEYFKDLRSYFMKYRINEILDFGNKQIFKDATVFTAICNVSKEKPVKQWVLKSDIDTIKGKINSDEKVFVFVDALVKKMDSYKKFDEYFFIKDVGYNYWSIGRGKIRGDSIGSRILYTGDKQNNLDIPYYKGSNIQKYILSKPSQYLKHNYQKFLKDNDIFRFTPELLETAPKVVYRQTSSSLIAAIDNDGFHNDKTVHIILLKDIIQKQIDLRYVLALFNSKLLNYFYQVMTEETGRAFAQVKIVNIKNLPLVIPNKAIHDKLVSLVDKMLELKQKEATEPNQQLKTMITRQIEGIDNAIDTAVYALYDLTEDEIKVVEG
ncbi:MAG: Eco57I restriction-modification methylase domain-containing protein [Treponema sp.]|nr:Eco57I restriction-modification methylase domain-containing protein [Treponema sp.]